MVWEEVNGRNLVINREVSACVKMDGGPSDSFVIGVEVRQGCIMSPWLFNIFMNGCMREIKATAEKIGARLKLNEVGWSVVACLFANDKVLLAE